MARLSLLFVIWLVYFKPTQQGNLDESHLAVIGSNSNPKTMFINESVPKECEELGLCENSKQYPKELVRKLIKELGEANITLDVDVPIFRYQQGFVDDFTNPCPSKTKNIVPVMIRALTDGQWYYSLKSEHIIQKYKVKICATTNSSGTSDMACNRHLILSNEYKSRCIQKWMIRKNIVVKDGKAHTILVNIPSSCSCVAVNK